MLSIRKRHSAKGQLKAICITVLRINTLSINALIIEIISLKTLSLKALSIKRLSIIAHIGTVSYTFIRRENE
jgi:hypothetical protein